MSNKRKKLIVLSMIVFLSYLYFTYLQQDILPRFIRMYFNYNIVSAHKYIRLSYLVITDLLYVLLLFIIYRKELISGIKKLRKKFVDEATIGFKAWLVGAFVMSVSTTILTILLKQDMAQNEALVRESIKLSPIYMFFSVALVAPFIEEVVFRKTLRDIINNNTLFIILSGVFFGLLHVVTKNNTNIYEYLYIIPYGAMGSAFAYMLVKTKNLALPIFIHMLHNSILVIIQIIGG